MSDEEWAVFAPFVTDNRARGGRPPRDHRRTLDGIFRIARTGAPRRDLSAEFGSWNSVYQQFRRWTLSGIWDVILAALADADPDAAESFNGRFRDECLSLEWFRSRAEAKVVIEQWRRHYNEVRPHSSLGYLTPAPFAAQAARTAPRCITAPPGATAASRSRPLKLSAVRRNRAGQPSG